MKTLKIAMRYFLSQAVLKNRKILVSVLALIFVLGIAIDAFAGKKVKWSAINPLLKGAISVGNSSMEDDETECFLCHKDYIKSFGKTKHAKAYIAKHGDNKVGSSCETCHGPMSLHLKEVGITGASIPDPGIKIEAKHVVSFKKISPIAKNAICLQCHEKNSVLQWQGSAHRDSGISCDNCHYVTQRKGKRGLLIKEDPKKVCFQCHREQKSKLYKISRKPLREGKQDCSGCHNPHGSFGPSLLKKATVNETCYMCHREKRGPLIWEHAPVRENCSTCHDPHGSNFLGMLKQKAPFLCQQCHMDVFHSSSLYEGNSLNSADVRMIGKSCLNCHSLIHGSNHPSGARFQR